MKTLISALVGALALATSAASAQDLNKAETGRLAVGNCYRQCAFQGYASGQFLIGIGLQAGSSFTTTEAFYGCVGAQEHVRNMDACYTSCLDIEQVYEVRNSHARSRFHQLFSNQRAPLQRAGLWKNYRTSPSYTGTNIDAFVQACSRYLYGTAGAVDALSLELEHSDGSEPFLVGGRPAGEFHPEELNELLRATE